MNIKSFGVLGASALLVSACGGGGGGGGGGFAGGGPAAATAVITEDNAEEIIREVAESSEIAQELLIELVFPPDMFPVNAATSSAGGSSRLAVKALAYSAISKISYAGGLAQLGAQPAAYPCANAGGTANVSFDGDTTTTFTFNNCTDFDNGDAAFPGTTNGQIAVDVVFVADFDNPFEGLAVDILWVDFSLADDGDVFMADGDMMLDFRETANAIQFGFTSDRFDYSENDESGSLTDYSYEMYFTSDQFREDGFGGIASSEYDGKAFFNINPKFIAVDDDIHSSSGQMIIYGINNTKIRLTALDAVDAQIELDLTGGDPDGGDDIYETSYTISWDSLLPIF